MEQLRQDDEGDTSNLYGYDPVVRKVRLKNDVAEYQKFEFLESHWDVEAARREKEIKVIQQKMSTVNQLFIEISRMVRWQGEKLNNIWLNIHHASEATQAATKDLEAVSVFLEEFGMNFISI
jgi:chromatin segregation and condensation protein Rec8/ScpA/Scc1 (kleisin family)